MIANLDIGSHNEYAYAYMNETKFTHLHVGLPIKRCLYQNNPYIIVQYKLYVANVQFL